MTAAFVGNPNCGKTTLFNHLTGSNQVVGNWAGVTVEKKQGQILLPGGALTVIDLPGIYSLYPYSPEERITRRYLLAERPNVILNILDGTNLERNLYLTLQLLELGLPVVVAVNLIDAVQAAGDSIDCAVLSHRLGIPVLPVSARRGDGVGQLVSALRQTAAKGQAPTPMHYSSGVEETLAALTPLAAQVAEKYSSPLRFRAIRLLEGEPEVWAGLARRLHPEARAVIARCDGLARCGDGRALMADARYRLIEQMVAAAVVRGRRQTKTTLTQRIDRVVTSRVFAIPIFLAVMGAMFGITFGALGAGLKAQAQGLLWGFTQLAADFLHHAGAAPWLRSLLTEAVLPGVGEVLSFLPQIALLFLFLSLLEDSGYLARGAFIMDSLLRRLGLGGRSFVPLLMGFGCTAPAVMAARTLPSEKDRRLTIMLVPFMSCGARLPIYGLFASVFFRQWQGLVVLGLYLLGVAVAVCCGLLLKNTIFRGGESPFLLELPPYRLPSLKDTARHLWAKCEGFLVKAGTLILTMTVVIWALQHITVNLQPTGDPARSLFAALGRLIAPVFAPLGFGSWQAATALLAGLVAKEAVVSTLGQLYVRPGVALAAALAADFTPLSALSFMVFSLLYMPCIAAFAAIRREMNSLGWALGTAALQLAAAYLCAFAVYQLGLLLT